MNTPVLLITFNRPEHTRKVLAAIMAARPKDLYVFQDGAREGNETDLVNCPKVREVVQSLVGGTETKLHTFYSERNLGCGPGPAAAITWYFENVEQGIIIEDDAVAHPDFFVFASEMLQRYKDDESVYAIGSMRIDTKKYGDGSYYFSMMNRCLCAWASWRRAWKVFDYHLTGVTKEALNDTLKNYYHMNLRMREKWCERLDILHRDCDGGSSWDMQFFISIWMHHGRGVFPNATLSSNIGFDEFATHGNNASNVAANRELEGILPIIHPSSEKIVTKADKMHDRLYTQPYNYGWSGFKHFPYRINRRIKSYLGITGSWKKYLLSKTK